MLHVRNVKLFAILREGFGHSKKCGIGKHVKSSDAKASKCHLKFSSLKMIFINLVYLSSVISLK